MAVDDGFNLSVEVTNSSWLSQISRRDCEATHKRFYLYRTIKLIDFSQFYMTFICKEKVLASVGVEKTKGTEIELIPATRGRNLQK